jgi:hypothetical protein
VRPFQTLVTSFHAAIVIETVEEERVRNLINTAMADLQMAVFEWSVAQGLTRSPSSPQNRWINEYVPPGSQKPPSLERTTDPMDALKHIEEMAFQAIFWLKDLTPHLKDEVVARQLREVMHQFSHNRSTLVMTGRYCQIWCMARN